ncbi:MAG: MqnA/MqnD/SBP family protein [Desulfonatronovibrionaceae bacterium]
MDQHRKILRAGISPCPNDTYIFGAWILGRTGDIPGCRTRFVWEDVQTLNEAAAAGKAQLIKVSAVQGLMLEGYTILGSGGAFGLGRGPKLVCRPGLKKTPHTIAVPGAMTTALALLRAAADFDFEAVPMSFDFIPEAVSLGLADAGLLIHETALIYQDLGFELFLDLGLWWDREAKGLPLPLGVILMDRTWGAQGAEAAEEIIRNSILTADQDREAVWPLIKSLARELDDRVIDAHIQAYVNRFSYDMGPEGRQALDFLQSITGRINGRT